MRLVALISGGKDSLFAMQQCITLAGHEFVAVANLTRPTEQSSSLVDNGESFMYQLQGTEFVQAIATCLGLPLIQRNLTGQPIDQTLDFSNVDHDNNPNDEVNDLLQLLLTVKSLYPNIQGVCCGAVLSTYQRCRVEAVCQKLNLTSVAMLWQRPQRELVEEMIAQQYNAVVVKVASMGLTERHVGKSIRELLPVFITLEEEFGFHVCGEGGEYETIVLDCPLFREKCIVLASFTAVKLAQDNCAVLVKPVFRIVGKAVTTTIQPKMVVPPPPPQPVQEQTTKGLKHTATHELIQKSTTIQSQHDTMVGPVHGDDNLDAMFESFFEQLKGRDAPRRMVFVHMFLRDMSEFATINAAYERHFSRWFPRDPPSRATVELAGLGHRLTLVSWLTKSHRLRTLHVKSISTWAPMCIGPYSQCNLTADGYAFVAGQIALEPATMTMAFAGHHVHDEVQQCMRNAVNVLQCVAGKQPVAHLCWVVYISSMAAPPATGVWNVTNEIGQALLKYVDRPSTVVIVTVSRLPRDAMVEIEIVGKMMENMNDGVVMRTIEYYDVGLSSSSNTAMISIGVESVAILEKNTDLVKQVERWVVTV